MQYFIGIVPPEEYLEQLVAFQKRWLSNGLPNVVEPHVTVKAQSGLNLDMAWLEKIKVVCSSFSKFQLSLSEPALFGNQVIFLSVQSNELLELHKKLVNVVTFTVSYVRVYKEVQPNKYQMYEDIKLA